MSLFTILALTGITLCGVLLMVAPALGREVLARLAKGAALFLLGMMVVQMSCSLRHSEWEPSIGFLPAVGLAIVGLSAGLALVGAGMAYVFEPEKVSGFVKKFAKLTAGLLVISIAMWDLVRTGGPLVSLLSLTAVSVVAYAIRQYRAKGSTRTVRRHGIERRAVLPGGLPRNRI